MVADSFVTTIEHSVDEDTFLEYINKAKNKKDIPIQELLELFKIRPSHTRNYVDKLFRFDHDSAVSCSGAAYINGKEIRDLVNAIGAEMQADINVYEAKSIDEKITEFCGKIRDEVLLHLQNNNTSETDFIFSHFNRNQNKPQVFVIKIQKIDKNNFDAADPNLVTQEERTHLKIISDGQDSFVDRLIFGSLYTNIGIIKREFLDYIIKKCKPQKAKREEIISEISDFDFLRNTIREDVFSIKFRELSLQEAVDLAALLIKIVMDIQVYTEKIPTVGGLIRLAVISKDKGFEWISGDKIIPPKLI